MPEHLTLSMRTIARTLGLAVPDESSGVSAPTVGRQHHSGSLLGRDHRGRDTGILRNYDLSALPPEERRSQRQTQSRSGAPDLRGSYGEAWDTCPGFCTCPMVEAKSTGRGHDYPTAADAMRCAPGHERSARGRLCVFVRGPQRQR